MLLAVLWHIFDRFFLQQTKNLFFSKKLLIFCLLCVILFYGSVWAKYLLIRRDME